MSYTRLSPKSILKLKNLAQKGVRPADLASFFGIGVSTVHNHKAKMKHNGVEFPSVRGRRSKLEAAMNTTIASKGLVERTLDKIQFVVGGISVQVDKTAKSVKVNKDRVQVVY